ncbi:MAG: trypsin-like serine protease, partial [Verrucomicrobiota bacterium]
MAAFLAPSSGFSIGTRHDVAPELYRALATNTGDYEAGDEIPDFAAVAAIGAPGRHRFDVVGSAVLINPQWVLTAAHVVMDATGKGDFDRELRVRFGPNASTQFEEYAISEFHVPIPISKLKPLQGGIRYRERHVVYAEFHDICLLKLDRPVENIEPIPACGNWGSRMLGRHVYISGYGDSGHGANTREESWAPAEVKRAAENQIDRDVTRNPFSNQQSGGLLLFDFDNGDPERNSLNKDSRVWNRLFGDGQSAPEPLEMEGASYPGDSGGPAIARIGGQWCVVGVSGYGTGFPPGKRQTSIQYGDILVYTRVASHANWIQQTIQAPPAAADQQLVAIFHEEPVKRGLFGRIKSSSRNQPSVIGN